MAEYGNGVSLMQCCTYDKERIKMALQGKLLCGEDEHGFIYEDADKAECDKYIIEAYDNCVYQLRECLISGNTFEKLLPVIDRNTFAKYMEKRMETQAEFDKKYPYRFDVEDED